MKRAGPSHLKVKAAILVTGISEGIVQVIILREILAGFYGTELLTGVIIAGWIVLNSIGCLLSSRILGKVSLKFLLRIQMIIGITAFLTCVGMLAGCSFLASNSHSQINWLYYSFLALLVLLPFCVSAGIQYVVSVLALAGLPGYDDLKASTDSYVYNSAGMFVGFLLATFFLITHFNTVESALLILGVNLAVVVLVSVLLMGLKKTTIFIFVSGIVFYAGIFAYGVPDRLFQSAAAFRVPMERIEETADTKYSRLLVTSYSGQYNFYTNGYLEGAYPDFDQTIEKKVHFALLMHPNPESVFIMGGLTAGVLDEILKYEQVEAVYGEIDPEYLSIALRYMRRSSDTKYDGVQFISSDVRSYLQQVKERFDVIIVIPPPPATLSTNRCYTKEFFEVAKNALKKDGLLCTSLNSSETYAGNNLKRLNYSIFRALGNAFQSTIIIPGEEGVVISSNSTWDGAVLKQTILQRYKDRHIATNLLSPEYINLMLDPIRIKEARENFSYKGLTIANNDYFPSAMQYYSAVLNERENVTGYHALNWFSLHSPTLLFLMFLLLLMAPVIIDTLFTVLSAKTVSKPFLGYTAFISGLTGFSCFSILIYMYQLKIGSLYGDIGFISAANLCGYSVGAIAASKLKKTNKRVLISVFLCTQALLVAILLSAKLPLILTNRLSFIGFILLWGIINGAVYPLLSKYTAGLNQRGIHDFIGLYMFELLGASFGATVTGILLLGTIGLTYTILLIVAALSLNILQLAIYTKERNKVSRAG